MHLSTVTWVGALILALGFLFIDSSARLGATRELYGLTPDAAALPAPDAASATGYTARQHRLILPAAATDGYQWLMQTEQMLEEGGLRVRHTQSDGPPGGREVHWSGAVRWWLVSVAWLYQQFHSELSLPQAVERAAPWAITFAFALFIAALTPWLARRFGGVAAALFALGCLAVQPLYQSALIGMLDHHALAIMCCFATVILLSAGGTGWVRSDTPDDPALRNALNQHHVLPDYDSARRFFVGSGVVAGIGLWISASTMVPVIVALNLGALMAARLSATQPGAHAASRFEPTLWRFWGLAGAVTSVLLYLLEYAPANLGLRLEVNHPLYALGWLALSDLVYRSGRAGRLATQLRWLSIDLAALVVLATVVVVQRTAFQIADPFLWALHNDYILEFRSLSSQLATLNPWLILPNTGVLPLIALPLAALLWRSEFKGAPRRIWRSFLVVLLLAGIAFVHVAASSALLAAWNLSDSNGGRLLVHAMCLLIDAAVVVLFFVWPMRHLAALSAPWRAQLIVALIPALTLLLLSFRQVRWLSTALALWLAVLVVAAGVLYKTDYSQVMTRGQRWLCACLLVFILLPFPLVTMIFPWRYGYPVAQEVPQVVTRDVAYTLRARLGNERGAVVSGPTTTAWTAYFGGMRGMGTLYWENTEGLKASADIFSASTPEQLRRLLELHRITHIVIYSWDSFVREYVRLARGQRRAASDAPDSSFIQQLLQEKSVTPDWLVRVPYSMPQTELLQDARVWIFEVARPVRVNVNVNVNVGYSVLSSGSPPQCRAICPG